MLLLPHQTNHPPRSRRARAHLESTRTQASKHRFRPAAKSLGARGAGCCCCSPVPFHGLRSLVRCCWLARVCYYSGAHGAAHLEIVRTANGPVPSRPVHGGCIGLPAAASRRQTRDGLCTCAAPNPIIGRRMNPTACAGGLPNSAIAGRATDGGSRDREHRPSGARTLRLIMPPPGLDGRRRCHLPRFAHGSDAD